MAINKRQKDYNLNRLFSEAWKDHSPTFYEVTRAREIEALMRELATQDRSWMHLDLHTAIKASKFEKFAKHAAIKPIDVTGFCIVIFDTFKNIDLPSL